MSPDSTTHGPNDHDQVAALADTVARLRDQVRNLDQMAQRRIGALEAEQFKIFEQLRRQGESAQRNGHALDDIEAELHALASDLADAIDQNQRPTNTDPLDPATEQHFPAATAPAATSAAVPPRPGPERETPDMAVLQPWVNRHIAVLERKTTTTGEGGGIRWCRRWWEHGEAVERFAALYLVWHELSADDSDQWLSVYLRDHLDPHLAALTSPYGPFHACNPRSHSDTAEPVGVAATATAELTGRTA